MKKPITLFALLVAAGHCHAQVVGATQVQGSTPDPRLAVKTYSVPLQFSNSADTVSVQSYNYCLPPDQKLIQVDGAAAKANTPSTLTAAGDVAKNCITVTAKLQPTQKFCSQEPWPTLLEPGRMRTYCSSSVPSVIDGTVDYKAVSFDQKSIDSTTPAISQPEK